MFEILSFTSLKCAFNSYVSAQKLDWLLFYFGTVWSKARVNHVNDRFQVKILSIAKSMWALPVAQSMFSIIRRAPMMCSICFNCLEVPDPENSHHWIITGGKENAEHNVLRSSFICHLKSHPADIRTICKATPILAGGSPRCSSVFA